MPAYIFQPDNVFREAVPLEFLENTVQILCDCYVQAYQDCLKYPKSERHDLRPHVRRGLFEWQWREHAQSYEELSADPIGNVRKTAFHTEIKCGPIILVESFVDTPTTIVRPALFRETLTMRYQPLFREQDEQVEESLFAILLHGAADARTPAFAHIAFPLRDEKGYHENRVDLFAWFSEIVASKSSFQEELVADEIEPELRKDVPNVGGVS